MHRGFLFEQNKANYVLLKNYFFYVEQFSRNMCSGDTRKIQDGDHLQSSCNMERIINKTVGMSLNVFNKVVLIWGSNVGSPLMNGGPSEDLSVVSGHDLDL